MLELFVTTKKELKIEESPLFKSSKMLNILNGSPKDFDIREFKRQLVMIDLEELEKLYNFVKNKI
jgi:hypothetical protein